MNFHAQIELLERSLDGSLRGVYLRQLQLLRDAALQRFKAAVLPSQIQERGESSSEYEGMLAADKYFT